MDPSAENAIRRIPASELTYEAFQRDFMLANQPVVVSGATESWRAFREWRTADGKPNLALLREKFGRSTVQVADCSQQRFSDQERLTMTVSDFISYWEQHIATRDSILHAHPPELRPAPPPAKAPAKILTIQSPYKQLVPPPDTSHTPQSSPPESNGDPEQVYSDTTLREVRKHGPSKGSVHKEETRLLYLKDWHFVAEYPDYHAYATPVYFQDDWLNEYLDCYPMQFEAGPRPSMADTACETEATGSQSEQNHSAASDDSSGARHLQLECTNRNNQSAHGQSVTQPAQFNETRPLEHVTSLTEGQTRPIPKHSSSSSPVPPPKSPTLEPTNRDPPPAYHQLDDSHSEPVHTESAGPLPGVECADYRFVYMGPAGSWTPCHADVLRSYSWSANVCGRKRWRLLPPDQAWMLLDRHGRSSVYDIDAPVDASQFPHFAQTRWLECIQEPGEAIFVPSGWFHQVTNLDDTISNNHNWLNGYNLHWAWALLQDDYQATVASIEDCRESASPEEFEELCQRNLQLNSGTNFFDFLAFVGTMALDKARKLRARTIGGRPGTAIATAADTADSDAASDLTVDGGPTVTDSTAPDGADVASELLSLNCACKVLREMGEQPLYTARIKDDEIGSSFQHLNEGMAEDEHTLELSRDSAIARGPWAIAEAVESITKETLKRTNVETGLYPEAVICWKR